MTKSGAKSTSDDLGFYASLLRKSTEIPIDCLFRFGQAHKSQRVRGENHTKTLRICSYLVHGRTVAVNFWQASLGQPREYVWNAARSQMESKATK